VIRESVSTLLRAAGPVDLHRTAGFLHRPDGGALRFTLRGLRGVVRAGRGIAVVGLEPARGGVALTLELLQDADVQLAMGAARQLAGLARNAGTRDAHAAFRRLAANEESLRPALAACRGLRLPQQPDAAACVTNAVLAQQVTMTFASELSRRVRERWGERVRAGGEEWLLAAPAERLAEVQPEAMRELQVSRNKAEYIRDLCREIADGTLDLHSLAALPAAEAADALTARRGIGPTTAAWLLAFGAGHPDAWPPGDVGLLRALERLHGRRVGRAIDRWVRPYSGVRSHLAVHLWEAQRAGALPDLPVRTRARPEKLT
jgi:DNA-3-methyladenine glycosylase II